MPKKTQETPIIEGEVVEARPLPQTTAPSTSLTVTQSAPPTFSALAPVMNLAVAKQRMKEFQEFIAEYLVKDEDFGTIPGTKKPSLYKPGADKLCELYGIADTYPLDRIRRVEDWSKEPPLFDYEITCVLIDRRTQTVISEGMGSCNSWEDNYRWRDRKKVCPECNLETIIKGKAEYGGGWLCFQKKGGCGAKFQDGDPAIEDQEVGRVINESVPTLKNTILKMAKKRAKIDATLSATRSSGVFTQDLEDIRASSMADDSHAPAATSEHSESSAAHAKVKKFAGTVIDAQRVDAGDHQVLILKLKYVAKRKGKDGKWTTVTEETIVVAEQSNFMRLLERSRDTKIEVECSQQSGGKGKMYWRVEKLLSGGTEPPAGETKAAPAETKPAEGKTMPKATDICECGHAAGNHAYGADACTIADCKCQSFRVKTTQTRNSGPETKTASSNPSAQSSDQPASSPAQPATVPATPVIVGQPPVVAKVQRNLVMAGGKKKAVEWLQVRGKVRGFGWSKDKHGVYQLLQAPTVATTSKRSEYIAVVLEGLPLWPDNQKGGHDLFLCWHKSLFECIKTLKVGDTFIFCYEQETVADGRVYQQIEDTEFVNGTEYLNGKPALPAPGEVRK